MKTGQWILENKQIPSHDFYSSLAGNQVWIDLHWIFQVLIYGLAQAGGLLGLNIFKLAVLIFIYVLFYRLTGRDKPLLTLFAFLGMLLISQERYQVRPEILSFAFMTIYLCMLETDSKYLWSLPFLQILWTNVEGLFMIGPALAGIYGLGQFLEKKPAKKYFLLTLCTFLVCFINPYGWKGVFFPFILLKEISLKNSMPSLFIGEFFPPYSPLARSLSNAFFFILLLAVALLLLIRIKKMRPVHVLLAMVFSALGLMAQRNTALFALIIPVVLLKNISIPSFKGISYVRFLSSFIFMFSCFYLCLGTVSNKYFIENRRLERFGLGVAPEIYPLKAIEYIAQKPSEGILFNTMDFGPAVILAGWPDVKPFIDTRLEVYTHAQLQEYKAFMAGEIPLDEFTQKNNIGIFLLDHIQKNSLQMITKLHRHPEWDLAYSDAVCVLFKKKTSESLTPYMAPEEPIKQSFYQSIREFFPCFPEEIIFPYQNIYKARLFLALDEFAAAEMEYQKVTEIYPQWTESWINLAFLEEKKGGMEKAIAYLKKALKYDSRSYQAYFNIGNLYLKTKQYSKAAEFLRKASSIQATPQVRHNLSIAEKFEEIHKIQNK